MRTTSRHFSLAATAPVRFQCKTYARCDLLLIPPCHLCCPLHYEYPFLCLHDRDPSTLRHLLFPPTCPAAPIFHVPGQPSPPPTGGFSLSRLESRARCFSSLPSFSLLACDPPAPLPAWDSSPRPRRRRHRAKVLPLRLTTGWSRPRFTTFPLLSSVASVAVRRCATSSPVVLLRNARGAAFGPLLPPLAPSI